MYRASINITPALPPRPNAHEEDEEEEAERLGERGGGGGEERERRGEEAAAGGLGVENLQELIREVCKTMDEPLTFKVLYDNYNKRFFSVCVFADQGERGEGGPTGDLQRTPRHSLPTKIAAPCPTAATVAP